MKGRTMTPTKYMQYGQRPALTGTVSDVSRNESADIKPLVKRDFRRLAPATFCLVVGCTLLPGCSTVPFVGYQPDGRYCFRIAKRKVCTADPAPSVEQEAKAKLFEVDPGRQVVWIVRNTRPDVYSKVSVSVNGAKVDMLPNTVSRFSLKPGHHHIAATYQSRELGNIAIVGKAGGQTFVEVHADIGIFATHFSLRKIPEEVGRRKAIDSKLISDQR